MSRLITVAAMFLCLSIGTASSPLAARGVQDRTSTLPDGPGGALVAAQCVSCHSLDEALSKRTTVDRWLTTVQEMVDRGAPIAAPDAAAIANYLGQHFGLDTPGEGQASGQGSGSGTGPGDGTARRSGPGRAHAEVFPVPSDEHVECHSAGSGGVGERDLPHDRARRALDRTTRLTRWPATSRACGADR